MLNQKSSLELLNSRKQIPHSMRRKIHQWEKLKGISTVVLNWIRYGVELPFQKIPQEREFPNRENFSQQEEAFISEEIRRMEECGALLRTNIKPIVLSPIHAVPKKNGKFRLVIDMRYLNSHLIVPKFKMEGLETLASMVEEGDHMFTVDLQDGYYHVNMAQNALPYMGLQWKGIYYVFRVLPFGLAISPLVFSKIMRSIIVHLRHYGHRILAYLDDFIGLEKTESGFLRRKFLRLLRKLGLNISVEKSSLGLEKIKEFLGLNISTEGKPMFFVPMRKKTEVAKEISRLIAKSKEPISARRVARVAGLCISLSRAIGPTRLLMRHLFTDLKKKKSWNGTVILSQAAIQDLVWWKDIMMNWDGKIVVPNKAEVTIFTDASDSGWGACLGDESARGFWTPDMLEQSINYRELMAVFMALLAFKPLVMKKTVMIRTDNISTAAYINKLTGPSDPLYYLGRAIQNLIAELGCELMAQYVPGVENITADKLSRFQDKND